MASSHPRYRNTKIALGKEPTNSEVGISLSARQLDMQARRRQAQKFLAMAPKLSPKVEKQPTPKAEAGKVKTLSSWSEASSANLHTTTAPTTSWADSASEASKSEVDTRQDFYGQSLPEEEQRKLYDDTGATWDDAESKFSGTSTDSIQEKQPVTASFERGSAAAGHAKTTRLPSKSRKSLPPRPISNKSRSIFKQSSKSTASGASGDDSSMNGDEDPSNWLRTQMKSYVNKHMKGRKSVGVADDARSSSSTPSMALEKTRKRLWSRKSVAEASSVVSDGKDKELRKKGLFSGKGGKSATLQDDRESTTSKTRASDKPSNVDSARSRETSQPRLSEAALLKLQQQKSKEHANPANKNRGLFLQSAEREYNSIVEEARKLKKDPVEMIYSQKPSGYENLLQTLHAEAMGTHPRLFDNFYSSFRGRKSSGLDHQRGKQGGGRFDDVTKDTVTKMSLHAKKASNNAQWVSTSQLAKTTPSAQRLDRKTTQRRGEAYESDKENEISRVASSDSVESIGDTIGTNEFEVTLSQHSRKSTGRSKSLSADALSECSLNVTDTSRASDQVEFIRNQLSSTTVDTETQNIRSEVPSFDLSLKQGSEDSIAPSDDSLFHDAVKGRTQRPPTTQTRRRSLEPKHFVPRSSESNDGPQLPWSSMKLRSVAGSDRDGTKSNPSPSSWRKVNLRHIDQKTGDSIEIMSTRSGSPVATSSEQTKTSLHENTLQVADEPPRPESKKTDESKGSKHVSFGPTPSTSDKATFPISFPLQPIGAQVESKVVVKKDSLVKTVKSKASVKDVQEWSLNPEHVKSILLDLAALRVRLITNDSRDVKELIFATKSDYMSFSNALSELSSASSETPNAMDESIVVELNEEEQRLLEEYREKRKTKPVAEALNESIVRFSKSQAPAPLSAVDTESGSKIEVLDAEYEAAEPYLKMLKMKIPREAVRHKMEKDKVEQTVIDLVLSENPINKGRTTKKKVTFSDEEKETIEKYKKMLKMRIPEEAVRHKMTKDSVTDSIVSAVFGNEASPPESKKGSDDVLSIPEQAIADKYLKMLKINIPMEAVEHKMSKDGVDSKIVRHVTGKVAAPVIIDAEAERRKQMKAQTKKTAVLTDEEESLASSYRQMIKLKIPKDAVRNRMLKEGVSEKIMGAVLGEAQSKKHGTINFATPKKRVPRAGFHWSPLSSDQKLDNSIWAKSGQMSFDDGISEASTDISKHIETFQKPRTPPEQSRKAKTKNTSGTKAMAKLIDINRANNVAISLQAFKDFSHEELANMIAFLDPNRKLRGDRIQFLKDLLPAPAEAKVVSGFNGSDDQLVPAELWFRRVVTVKRLEEKVQTLRTMGTFAMDIHGLMNSFQLLIDVCQQVMSSQRLPDLLYMVRQLGNTMNKGHDDVVGFKLDFLPRLTQTKGSDRKTTALDLVVMIFVERNQREGLLLGSDFPNIADASKIQFSELESDVRLLKGALNKCKKERENIQDDIKPPSLEGDTSSSAGVSHAESVQDKSMIMEKRAKFLSSLKEKKSKAATLSKETTKSSSDAKVETKLDDPAASKEKQQQFDYTPQSATKRVNDFLEEANELYERLEKKRDEAKEACIDLSNFFCEPGGERSASSLLKLLMEFSENLASAVRKHDEKLRIQERKAASSRKKAAKASKQMPAPESRTQRRGKKAAVKGQHSEDDSKSLVLMVYEMCKIAGDKTKEDFINGVTYNDTDDHRLQAIYKKETGRQGDLTSPRGIKRDIIDAMDERQSQDGPLQTEKALSALAEAMEKRASMNGIESSASSSGEDLSAIQPAQSSDDIVEEASNAGSDISAPMQVIRQRADSIYRWTDKSGAIASIQESSSSVEENQKTDSDILLADSDDHDDPVHSAERRRSYLDRWTRKGTDDDTVSEIAETEIGFPSVDAEERRQSLLSRWANRGSPEDNCEDEEEVDEAMFDNFR